MQTCSKTSANCNHKACVCTLQLTYLLQAQFRKCAVHGGNSKLLGSVCVFGKLTAYHRGRRKTPTLLSCTSEHDLVKRLWLFVRCSYLANTPFLTPHPLSYSGLTFRQLILGTAQGSRVWKKHYATVKMSANIYEFLKQSSTAFSLIHDRPVD